VPKKVHFGWLALAAVSLLALLTACGGGGGGVSAEEILANAAEATLGIETVQFAIEREGELPVIESSTGAKFINATGFYQAPDTVNAIIRAETSFGVQDFGVIWSPEGNSMTIPGLGTIEIPGDFEFSPATLFQQEGLPSILTEALVDVTLEGEETFEGVEVYHVTGTASGESLTSLTAGAVTVDDMAVDAYVNREIFEVVHIALTESTGERWLLDLFAYNESVVG
jgi:hypothetical protein